jgi:rsbT co-antagonist protein RsbR
MGAVAVQYHIQVFMSQKETLGILPSLLARHEADILRSWLAAQVRDRGSGRSGVRGEDLRRQSEGFLRSFQEAVQSGTDDIDSAPWSQTREFLSDLTRDQARQGATPSEVATFIFSLKEIVFRLLQTETGKDPEIITQEIWHTSRILDQLGLMTTEVALKAREEVIARQQVEMLELSTPVVKLWDGILALPLIGTLDSERTQVVMESLLEEIVRSSAAIAIIDITGVPTVDTLVAQHLLKTVAAARLMGAECIISGIRPQIASTIVHLGVDLGDVVTKATLADAFQIALRRNQMAVVRISSVRKSIAE